MRETNFVLIAYTFRIVLFFSVLTRNTVLFFLPVPPYISLHFFNFTCHLNLYTLETLFLSLPLYIQHRFFFTHTHMPFCSIAFFVLGTPKWCKAFQIFHTVIARPTHHSRRFSRCRETKWRGLSISKSFFFFFFF